MVKKISVANRMHFKNDGCMEDDDFIEIRERLENIYEAFDSINLNREREDSESDY